MLIYILLRSSLLSQHINNITNEDNIFHEVNLRSEDDEKNEYLFYNQEADEEQILKMNDEASIKSSDFDAKKPTVVYVHEWRFKARVSGNLRAGVLEALDSNVIMVDWSHLASFNYVSASHSVPRVGRDLGRFLRFLNSVTGAPFDKMHLIGYGLGAHAVGNAGRELGGKIARITGLDPTGPLWRPSPYRLTKNDAIYVEAIHTSMSLLNGIGMRKRLADVDFYPNGGKLQPKCKNELCDHELAYRWFIKVSF